ncbi:MAG: hypothetical protein IPP59_01640 [Betaproteobacteria bacterium]|nr:hypothetical protein [Candidatus Dechloromonas phosphorivorans]
MKTRVVPCLLLLLSLLGSAGSAWAQASWRDLPPEERREMRQQMREHWQQDRNMRREEGPRRWQEVPPEDRRRLRDEMREQGRGQGDHQRRDGRGGRHD